MKAKKAPAKKAHKEKEMKYAKDAMKHEKKHRGHAKKK